MANPSSAVELSEQRTLSDLEKQGLLTDGEDWVPMIKSRNQTWHTYNQTVADEITTLTTDCYHGLFAALEQQMSALLER